MSELMPSDLNLSPLRACLVALIVTLALWAAPAHAQVVALVNGAPITELDVTQRIKLIQIMSHRSPTHQQALKDLVDDHVKISITRRYGIEPSNKEVDNAFTNMAQRSRMSAEQMEQSLTHQGLSTSALKLKMRADLGWNNLIRSKYASTLQISETDIRGALQSQSEAAKAGTESNSYTLYPITFVAPNGAAEGARRGEAENLRSRFTSCAEGLKLARALRGVVVRDAIRRGSADLAPALREILNKMEIGRLTVPEVTPQGVQMFALCERKEGDADSPAKRAAREEIFSKRFDAESKKYLDEVRRQSMIEYR